MFFLVLLCVSVLLFCKKAQKGYYPAVLELFLFYFVPQKGLSSKSFFSSYYVVFSFCLPLQNSIFVAFCASTPFWKTSFLGFLLLFIFFPVPFLMFACFFETNFPISPC